VVLAVNQARRKEGAEDLRENIIRNFSPWETLPICQAKCNGGVEVTSGGGSADYNGKGDAESKSPADLEDGSERGSIVSSEWLGTGCGGGGVGECEAGDRGYSSVYYCLKSAPNRPVG